ncbi:hypothetical protein RJ640_008521 [Escallonia rubra]|uniref:F-box domain-containing protein n=1 Tax=Escallonia rubra TaxID=112253 RepID=A0AA88S7W1_9ASTE|nr:hypothetical protein RJ640_008521 [Escallonia rubra]
MLRNKVLQLQLLNGEHFVGRERNMIRKPKGEVISSTTQLRHHWKLKRKFSLLFLSRNGNRKKRKIGKTRGVDKEVDTTDRTSELPEHILHHILSFIRCPKDVIRTSVLSKKWRSIWASFLTFDFDQKSFQAQGGVQREKFKCFVENSLASRLEPMLCIHKFRLYLTSFNLKLAPHMNRWIKAAISKDVKELEVHLEVKGKRRYILPQEVLSAKTLTSLKLYGCKLDNSNVIKLPNLQELSIKKARVDVDMIQSFIRCCSLLEDLRLINCTGLRTLHVSTLHKLNRIEVHECHGLKSVEIELRNLRTFWFYGKITNSQCKINLAGCENLRNLTLNDPFLTDESFHNLIAKFPFLEQLVLTECNKLERITILSGKLKRLALVRCKKLEEANIDAPNLFSFEYTGDKVPFSSMNISCIREAKLHIESGRWVKSLILRDVQSFLGKCSHVEGLKSVVLSDKNVTVHEELGGIQFAPSSDLKLELIKSSLNLKDHVISLLRTCRPTTLSIISSPSSEFLKFIHEKIVEREKKPNCCRYYSRKCWLHYLQDVEIEIFEAAGLVPSPTMRTTTFRLKWASNEQRG